jgi:lysozyme
MEVKMIDVSVHNGVIDWDKVKASGIGGVLMRCGYGSDIESQDDKMFKRNADECSRLGIPFGVYLYSYAKNTDMAKSEADHALRLVKGYKLSYPLYIDVEEASQSGIAKDVVKVFCEAVKAAGYMPGVYANENWWNNYLVGVDSYTKWVAKYGVNNGQPGNKPNVSNFDIWQYTSKGSCDGIGSSGLDMNICYRDFPAELGGSKPAPAPAEKSNEEIANEVLAGTWGNGDDRKNRLSAAGYDYDAIQAIVNQKAAPAKKSNEEIANEVLAGTWGNGDDRKNRLSAAGYDYDAIQAIVNQKATPAKKSNEEIAKEVLAGAWGNGDDRKNRLSAAGYDYDAIQAIVNQKATPAKKSNEEIAKEVLAGKWGNNPQRKAKLEAAGYNYATIQALVNKMC